MRPPVHPPRKLTSAQRLVRRALGLLDCVNTFVDYPKHISLSEIDRAAHVAGALAMRSVFFDHQNASRRAAWRARFGGCERDRELSGSGATYSTPEGCTPLRIRMVGGGGGGGKKLGGK